MIKLKPEMKYSYSTKKPPQYTLRRFKFYLFGVLFFNNFNYCFRIVDSY